MKSNQERYFILSGIISISLFLALLFLIGFSILKSTKIQQFALTQSEFVSISLAVNEAKTEPKMESVPVAPAPEPETKPAEQPETQKEAVKPEPVPDISDLFSDIKATPKPQKKVEDTKRIEQLNVLEKQLASDSRVSNLSEKVKNTEIAKPSVNMTVEGGSSGPVVNEYHAKIQGLVYANFHPPQGTQGQVSRVQVKISANGSLLWFKVKARSGNQPFDNEVQWLKERLGKVVFPPHPEGRDTILEFILKAKE